MTSYRRRLWAGVASYRRVVRASRSRTPGRPVAFAALLIFGTVVWGSGLIANAAEPRPMQLVLVVLFVGGFALAQTHTAAGAFVRHFSRMFFP
jgi:hypothetical protein